VNTVRFRGESCNVQFGKYANGRTAIMLVCDNGEPMAKATVNLDTEDGISPAMGDDEVAIKDYNENAGMLEALEGAGVISAPLRHVPSGFVRIPICRLLVRP